MNSLRKSIESQAYFDKKNNLLVAVSGGLDSMVLCHILLQANFPFSIAHVNYHLREQESLDEENLVRQFANTHGINFFCKDVKSDDYAKENLQAKARKIRYTFFSQLMDEHRFDFLLTAHHKDDRIETYFLHLMRGAGLNGLKSIKEKKGKTIRPLLQHSKFEILEYAMENNVAYLDDSSNHKSKYNRNYLRNEVLPILEKRFPNYRDSVCKSMDQIRSAHLELSHQYEKWKETQITDFIDKQIILIPEEIQTYMLKWHLSKIGFHYNAVDQILSNLHDVGKQFISTKGITLTIDRSRIIIYKNKKNKYNSILKFSIDQPWVQYYDYKIKIEQSYIKPDLQLLKSNPNVAFLDAKQLSSSLYIRRWQHGDRIKPLGMQGQSKKVQDILTDLKIPILDKDEQLVLVDGNKIFWLAGKVISDEYKIHDTTTEYLRIELMKV